MSGSRRGRSLAEVMAPIEDEGGMAHPPAAPAAAPGAGAGSRPAPEAASGTLRGGGTDGQAVVPVNVLVAPEDRRRLRQLSLDAGLSLQKLGHEAWNLLLQKRGLPPLKPVSASVPSGRAGGRARR
jgi:hypothetical protein